MPPKSSPSLLSWMQASALLWSLWAAAASAESSLLKPYPAQSDTYAESFTFVADLEDGSYAWAQLFFTNAGPGSRHGVCRALWVRPHDPTWTGQLRTDAQGWRHDAQGLRVDTCLAREGEKPEIQAFFPTGRLTLRFEAPFRPLTPPDAQLSLPEGRYRTELLQPSAPVSVRFEQAGKPPLQLRGGGYADHSHSTIGAAQLARRWVRFRALGAAPTLLLARENPQGHVGSPAYLWTPAQGFTPLKTFALHRSGPALSPQWQVDVPLPVHPLTLRSMRFLHRSAPLQELGWLGKMLKPVMGSPVTYTYRAQLERPDQEPLPGLLEVSLSEE